jgi:hypothetical protein
VSSIIKPTPVPAVPLRALCPVCGKIAYSHGGIHPQCAMFRADKVVREARKKAAGAGGKPVRARQQWIKRCPKCGRQVPSRRVTCDCGHNFSGAVKSW